jgi:hypothetical protein
VMVLFPLLSCLQGCSLVAFRGAACMPGQSTAVAANRLAARPAHCFACLLLTFCWFLVGVELLAC